MLRDWSDLGWKLKTAGIFLNLDKFLNPAWGGTGESANLQLYASGAGGDGVYDISVHIIINHNPNLSAATGQTYDELFASFVTF